jgi:hypothetical protein
MSERVRSIRIVIEIDTNKQTIARVFDSASAAVEWLLEHHHVVLVEGVSDLND